MYKYEELKKDLFTERGVQMLLKARDNVNKLLDQAGAFQLEKAVRGLTGDSWTQLACIDYLVEQKEIKEVTDPRAVAGQHRVFVRYYGA